MRTVLSIMLIVGTSACANPEAERLKATTRPSYDNATGRLTELTFDSNRNRTIDTWIAMNGSRPLSSRIDHDEDGRIDRWEYYDQHGKLKKVGFSRSRGVKPDAWTWPNSEGRVERLEISSTADEKRIDRWEYYDTTGPRGRDGFGALLRVEEDSNADGRADKWMIYEAGAVKTAEFDEDYDGKPDRRLTYNNSTLVLIESERDASGHYTRRIEVDP